MNLESGPARTDSIWWGAFSLLCLGLSAYFYYDGTWGYPNQNRAVARQRLSSEVLQRPADDVLLGERPSGEEFQQAQAARPATIDVLNARFGTPLPQTKAGPSGEVIYYYASLYGLATVPTRAGAVVPERMQWVKWHKDKPEIEAQLYFAILTLAASVYPIWRFQRAARLRARLDETGVTYGRVKIPYETMTSLRDYSPKGWVDLYYKADGVERKLRIDNQKIARFAEIIDALCAAKNFENPIRAYEAQQELADDEETSDSSSSSAST